MKQTEAQFSIQTPLFVFRRVFRGTGTIRKTCLLRNESKSDLELDVSYNFKEHSWLQIVPQGPGSNANPNKLKLSPGDTRVQVQINTDSSNFPYDQFIGRIQFGEEQEQASWVEINFEEIGDLSDFDGYAAIDLGTNSSTISLYHLHENAASGFPWNPKLEKSQNEVPSAVFIQDFPRFRRSAPGSCTIGEAAIKQYRQGPEIDPRSLQLATKRLIGSKKVLAADANGSGGHVEASELLYMLGRHLREESQNHPDVKARIKNLSVTFPPTWDYNQIQCWKDVFKRLGFTEDQLDLSLDEASAAGLFHIYRWIRDADERKRLYQDLLPSFKEINSGNGKAQNYTMNLLSYDFGGGTIDLAFIQVEITLLEESIKLSISLKGSDSLNYGGDQVTLAIFRILKRRLALARTDFGKFCGQVEEKEDKSQTNSRFAMGKDDGFFLLPSKRALRGPFMEEDDLAEAQNLLRENWELVQQQIGAPALAEDIESAINQLFPTRFLENEDEPLNIAAKRNFDWLWDCSESLKKQLFVEANRKLGPNLQLSDDQSEQIEGGLPLSMIPEQIPGHELASAANEDSKISLNISEIYQSIGSSLQSSIDQASTLVADQRVDRVVLTGQSCHIPLVRRLFMQPKSSGGLGLPNGKIYFDEENAKAAVSKGACILKVMRDTLVGFEVDIADFKANLLSKIYYRNPLGSEEILFDSGSIEDFCYHEVSPQGDSFAKQLSVFTGRQQQLMGRFDFASPGEKLPDAQDQLQSICQKLELPSGLPSPTQLHELRAYDSTEYHRISSEILALPEASMISWIEAHADHCPTGESRIRFYLTRNRNLLALVDKGTEGGKSLHSLILAPSTNETLVGQENPFSGLH